MPRSILTFKRISYLLSSGSINFIVLCLVTLKSQKPSLGKSLLSWSILALSECFLSFDVIVYSFSILCFPVCVRDLDLISSHPSASVITNETIMERTNIVCLTIRHWRTRPLLRYSFQGNHEETWDKLNPQTDSLQNNLSVVTTVDPTKHREN